MADETTDQPGWNRAGELQASPEPILFEARLTPHRSLSPKGFAVFLVVTGVIGFAYGMMFVMMGAWPIVAFIGTEWLLLWWLFRKHLRGDGTVEWLRLYRDRLLVDRGNRQGHIASHEFQPYWLQVQVTPDGSVENELSLRSHGRSVEIGHFLSPGERLRLAEELRRALALSRTT